ncbi:MAG: DUF167 domain-containing protein [Candidatus Hodarchaeales archaeon]
MQNMRCVQADGEDVLITVNIKTNQHFDEIIFERDSILIKVKEPPHKGKANKKILKILKKNFRSELFIERGETSSLKKIRIKNISLSDVMKILKKNKHH